MSRIVSSSSASAHIRLTGRSGDVVLDEAEADHVIVSRAKHAVRRALGRVTGARTQFHKVPSAMPSERAT